MTNGQNNDIFNIIIAFITPLEEQRISNYGIIKNGLKIIKDLSYLFINNIIKNGKNLIEIILSLCASQNTKIKIIAIDALECLLNNLCKNTDDINKSDILN